MRILVAAGGSGGHVYPALAVLEELRARRVLAAAGWIGQPQGLEARVLTDHPWIQFFPVRSSGLARRRPWTWPSALGQAALNVVRCARILRFFRPDVVLGMGGYASFAPALAAWLLRIPTAIHEQNACMGLVNRILSLFSDRVLISFPHTRGVLRRSRVCLTGNPVRAEVVGAAGPLGDELLVVGGSLGSRTLVEAVVRASPILARLPGLRVRLVVGSAASAEETRAKLAQAGVHTEVVEYEKHVGKALSRARLVVARAGATTVAELAAAGRPAVLVPWDGATGRHQHENARALARSGGCLLVEEQALEGPALGDVVAQLWRDEARLAAMSAAARSVARPDAARRVAEALLALVEER